MVDHRFFHAAGTFSLGQLAEIGGCELSDKTHQDKTIANVAAIEDASEGDITFLSNKKYANKLQGTKATACIIAESAKDKAPEGLALLIADDPYLAFAKIASALFPSNDNKTEISPQAHIDASATIGENVTIEPGAVIKENAVIGDGCFIGAHSYVGAGVIIGNHCQIHPNVTLTHSIIGNNTTLFPGARIGQDGFGFATTKTGQHVKVPQLGRVIIGDDVEIGANTCIDRGSTNDTIIEDGCRLDNLVQIGHNARIGQGSVLVSQVGISGSTKVGKFCAFGGQVGIAGHLNIGDQTQIAAQSGVMHDLEGGQTYAGTPTLPFTDQAKLVVMLRKMIQKKKA